MALEGLLPRQAGNDYRGRPLALHAFVLLAVVVAGRSLVHLLKSDAGLNSIAGIVTFSGEPDPDTVIHMLGSLWGSQQLVMALVYGVVLLRYRSLVPLMWALMIVEVGLRMLAGVLHPLGEAYFLHTPPGKLANLPLLVLSSLMLWLALPRGGAASGSTVLAREGGAPSC